MITKIKSIEEAEAMTFTKKCPPNPTPPFIIVNNTIEHSPKDYVPNPLSISLFTTTKG